MMIVGDHARRLPRASADVPASYVLRDLDNTSACRPRADDADHDLARRLRLVATERLLRRCAHDIAATWFIRATIELPRFASGGQRQDRSSRLTHRARELGREDEERELVLATAIRSSPAESPAATVSPAWDLSPIHRPSVAARPSTTAA
jgi:hypothetical protein